MVDRDVLADAEARALDRPTARDATADDQPVRASDPRSVTVDRGAIDPASPGAADDEALARQQSDA